MALPTIADCFRVALDWEESSGPHTAANVMHFSAPGKTESDVFTALDTHVTAAMWGTVAASGSVLEVVVTKLDGTPDGRVNPIVGHPAKWGGGAGQMIPQAATIVKLVTAATGRSGRGRAFLPWLGEDKQNGGTIDPTTAGVTQTAWIAFANAMAADGVALGVASYLHSSWSQALAITVDPISGTVRRRNSR